MERKSKWFLLLLVIVWGCQTTPPAPTEKCDCSLAKEEFQRYIQNYLDTLELNERLLLELEACSGKLKRRPYVEYRDIH